MRKTSIENFPKDKGFYFSHSITEKPSNPSHNIHIHDFFEIYYFISGDVTYYIEGQTYKLGSNDLLIINSNELHRPFFDSDEVYERITIHFRPEFISSFNSSDYNLLHCFEKRKLGMHNKISAEEVLKNGIDKFLKDIESYKTQEVKESSIMITTIFVQMLIALNNIFKDKNDIIANSSEGDKKIAYILDYINNNLSEKLTLSLFEQKFFVNKYYLCHIFKRSTGFTVLEYITYKRIMKAKELLSSGMPVLEVSNAVGFGDYSNFYKVFKRIVGSSPREFLR